MRGSLRSVVVGACQSGQVKVDARWLTLVVLVALLAGCQLDSPDSQGRDGPRKRDNPTKAQPSKTPRAGGSLAELAKGQLDVGWRVIRVVDGDTVEVTRQGRSLTLRLIGIDTPETVHPTEPVQCFGPQASQFATRNLLGEPVTLEYDQSQGRLDYYGRTLGYVWTTAGRPTLFNGQVVKRGFGYEYTYDDPYAWQAEFRRAETRAQQGNRGLWKECN